MSKDVSGLPPGIGMAMAVRHLVCVFEGAPGPAQGAAAKAIPVAAAESNRTGASAVDQLARKFVVIKLLLPKSFKAAWLLRLVAEYLFRAPLISFRRRAWLEIPLS